jgi:hypothetical protein
MAEVDFERNQAGSIVKADVMRKAVDAVGSGDNEALVAWANKHQKEHVFIKQEFSLFKSQLKAKENGTATEKKSATVDPLATVRYYKVLQTVVAALGKETVLKMLTEE